MHDLGLNAIDVYIDEAADGIAQGNVYVSSEVPGAAQLQQELEQQVTDESIAVVVFSEHTPFDVTGREIASELASRTGYDTIIVAIGDDLSAGSHVLPPGEAMRIANEAESSADAVDAAIVETVDGVIAEYPAGHVPGEGGATEGGGGDAGLFIGLAVSLAVLVAAGGALWGVLRARRRNRPAVGRHPLPEPVRTHVQTLQALTAEYARAGAAGVAQAGEVAAQVGLIAQNTTELFERLDRKGEEGQRPIAAVEYGETLRKLTGALDRDYLLDILTHPDLWDDPAERVREVRTALSSFSTELVENIKQVNARRGLHFQVSLDGLMGRRKELQDWDRAFERADGDTGPVPHGD